MIRTPGDRRSTRLLGVAAIAGLVCMVCVACDSKAQMSPPTTGEAQIDSSGIWISRDEVRSLPTNGAAWEALVEYARRPVRNPDVSNQDDSSNVRILAKALYFVRTGEESYAREVIQALDQIRGTEKNARTLAIGREVIAYVVAADLVELEGADRQRFEDWLRSLRKQVFQGRTIRSTHEDRPNNWGTHAGATRLAIAAYLGDRQEIERAAHVFRGWTGEAQGWQGFEFREDWWQPTQMREFAINPAGAIRDGHPIGGVLPDDQRRAGRFRWPPPKENYVYEALQGAIEQAVLLERLGYDAWQWGDRALLRSFEWLHAEAHYPAEGDDTWLPPIVNRAYGAKFPAPTPSAPGKGMGFADWTHGSKAPEPIKNP